MSNRNYIYKTMLNEIIFLCVKDNINACPFGSIFYEKNKECKYLVENKYCDNKFIHSTTEGSFLQKLTDYIMHDTLDMIDTLTIDQNNIN